MGHHHSSPELNVKVTGRSVGPRSSIEDVLQFYNLSEKTVVILFAIVHNTAVCYGGENKQKKLLNNQTRY